MLLGSGVLFELAVLSGLGVLLGSDVVLGAAAPFEGVAPFEGFVPFGWVAPFEGAVPFGFAELFEGAVPFEALALGSLELEGGLVVDSLGSRLDGSSRTGGTNLAASPPAYLNHPSPSRKSKTGIAINAASVSAWSKVAILYRL